MRVLFSNPPWWEGTETREGVTKWRAGVRAGSRWPFTTLVRSAPDQFVPGEYMPYPFFMGYAATYAARETSADIHFRDSIALRESYDRFFAYLDEHAFDVIVVEIATPSWEHDQTLLGEIRRRHPGTRLVVTGPITTTKSDTLLNDHGVHACIRGEYEKNATRVIEGASGLLEHDLLTREEMNAAPFPWLDDLHWDRYWDRNPVGQIAPHAQVWSSRGCPFKCIFCVWPATMTGNDPDGTRKREVRHYTPEYMEAYLTEITERYPFRSIYFDDDTFNLGTRHVERMCTIMERIGLPWSAMCRADTSKMETWTRMKEAGCFGVKLGFESGNQYVVDKIVNKHLDLGYGRDVVIEIKRLGMSVHGTFTYGLPGETRQQMLDTRTFIESLPFDSFQESGTAEIEGTPLHTLTIEGRLAGYEGASIDAAYDRQTDGSRKWERLVRDLQQT